MVKKSLVLDGRGKFVNRRTKTANKDYDKFFIYIPVEVARDSTFPFKSDQFVRVKIDRRKNRLLVERE